MDDSTARGHRSLKSSSLQSCHPPRAVTRSILVIPWGIVHKSSHPPRCIFRRRHPLTPASVGAVILLLPHPLVPSSTSTVILWHRYPLEPSFPGVVIPWRRYSLASSFPGVVIPWRRHPLVPLSSVAAILWFNPPCDSHPGPVIPTFILDSHHPATTSITVIMI